MVQQIFHRQRSQRLIRLEMQHLIDLVRSDIEQDSAIWRHDCYLSRLIVSTTLMDEVREDIH